MGDIDVDEFIYKTNWNLTKDVLSVSITLKNGFYLWKEYESGLFLLKPRQKWIKEHIENKVFLLYQDVYRTAFDFLEYRELSIRKAFFGYSENIKEFKCEDDVNVVFIFGQTQD